MASARLIREAIRPARQGAEEELDPLLPIDTRSVHEDEEEYPEEEDAEEPHWAPNPHADLPVYERIWSIRKEIIKCINDPYTLDQIRAPRLNTSVIRPLLDKWFGFQDVSIVFCLLVNRIQFLRGQSYEAHYQSVNTTRALVCEVLAVRILRQFDEESYGVRGLLLLANIVIASFDPFQNAPAGLTKQRSRAFGWAVQNRGGYERQTTALEVAIISESKLFISSPACQKVVDAIYAGRIVYTPISFIDILPDHYKHKTIRIYDPVKAPALNQYRLVVPRIRNIIEICQFILLLILYIWVMTTKDPHKYTTVEIVFSVYTFGWILDQLASILGHGWQVYSHNLWSFLDVIFAVIFMVYFILRMHGLQDHDPMSGRVALDVLAMGAPFLVPRLAFNVFSENLVFVSLRDMMAKFLLLVILAVWSFGGFFLAMLWLNDGEHQPITIVKWMVWVWFGLDGTGVGESYTFHWLLGPILMVAFAILGNTLFLTILVSTLSNAFSNIMAHSNEEIQFRRAVLTFEGVKSDAIFAYQPPFNMLALFILLPLKLLTSPRWFHKINATANRFINAPLLLIIRAYERRNLWPSSIAEGRAQKRRRTAWADFFRFHIHSDIQAVFDVPPPETPAISRPPSSSSSSDDGNGPAGQADKQHGATSFPHSKYPHRTQRIDSDGGTLAIRPQATRSRSSYLNAPSISSAEEQRRRGLAERLAQQQSAADAAAAAADKDESGSQADVDSRLKRIESMLGRVCDQLDDAGEDS